MQCQAKAKSTGEQCKRRAVNGKRVCTVHGGLTPGGLASPNLKTGRYSKYLPAQLQDRYQEAVSDPDILSLNEDVALLRSLVFKHLESMSTGDTHPSWKLAYSALQKLKKAIATGDAGDLLTAMEEMEAVITPNYRAAVAEDKVTGYIDQLGRIADKERRLLIDRQQVITVERMMLMITAIAAIVKQHVDDRNTLRDIQTDIQGLLVSGS